MTDKELDAIHLARLAEEKPAIHAMTVEAMRRAKRVASKWRSFKYKPKRKR